jgi:hypothetical protein
LARCSCLEKYLKAALLLNGLAAKKYGHVIEKLYAAVRPACHARHVNAEKQLRAIQIEMSPGNISRIEEPSRAPNR